MTMQTLTQPNAVRPITYQEFREMDFEEQELNEFIFELINGEIVARNYPTESHQRSESGYELESFAVEKGDVESIVLTGLRVAVDSLFT